jgi:hypothetical protein
MSDEAAAASSAPEIAPAIEMASAVAAPPAEATCGLCNAVVGAATLELVNGRPACAPCVAKVRAELAAQEPGGSRLALAAAGGLGGALAGALVWAGIAVSTQLEVGYVAVLIGFLTGYGVKLGAGKQRGPTLQYAASVLSVVGLIAAKYAIFAYVAVSTVAAQGIEVSYFDERLRALFPAFLKESFGILDLLFVFLALRAAYRVPRAHVVTFSRP